MRNDIKDVVKQYLKEERCLLNKSEMARRFDCDPRTIDRYLKIQSGELKTRPLGRQYTSLLDNYKETIINKVDVHSATAMSVYKFIQKKGYGGKYSTVAAFVSKHKNDENHKATVRFETTPGLQAQVDWKENLKMVNRYGEIFTVNIFLMVLGYSRAKYISLTTNRNQETLFECMIGGFGYFGGVPHEILFDNMKTVVDRSKSNFTRVEFNETFRCFAKDAGFKPLACRPYRPQTKGKAEALAKLTNRLVVYNDEFEDYAELECIVNSFREEINSEISQATSEIPFKSLKREQEYLIPLPSMDMLLSYVSRKKEYKISKDSMITYDGKKYSVPTEYIGKKLNITETCDGSISIYYNDDLVVCHSVTDKKFNYKIGHIHEILKSDACRHLSNTEIDQFIRENISMMDIFLGE